MTQMRDRARYSVLKFLVGSGKSSSRGPNGPNTLFMRRSPCQSYYWLLGVPLTLVLALWLFEVVGF